jgi:hypothetical protein
VPSGRIRSTTDICPINIKQQHIIIFVMMHHNLIEHYAGQSQLDPGYVIDDFDRCNL